jgi:hypothetical protein
VLAAADFDLKFTNILASWKESAHDPSILAVSLARANGSNTHDGKFYLEYDGYACQLGVLPPFRKTRYHLNKFSARNRPKNAKELFNLRHSRPSVNIEREFVSLKNRFKLLEKNCSTLTSSKSS